MANASVIIIHPSDLKQVPTIRTSDGLYYLGGLSVIACSDVELGTYILIDKEGCLMSYGNVEEDLI